MEWRGKIILGNCGIGQTDRRKLTVRGAHPPEPCRSLIRDGGGGGAGKPTGFRRTRHMSLSAQQNMHSGNCSFAPCRCSNWSIVVPWSQLRVLSSLLQITKSSIMGDDDDDDSDSKHRHRAVQSTYGLRTIWNWDHVFESRSGMDKARDLNEVAEMPLSSCLSTVRVKQLWNCWTNFHKIWYWEVVLRCVDTFQF